MSSPSHWQNIELVHLLQPPHEMPNACLPLHTLIVLPSSALINSTIDGVTRQQAIAPGEMMIVPANIEQAARWTTDFEMIAIELSPSLFAQVSEDATNCSSVELAPQFATPDPLVHQLGLSLISVLKQNPTGSRLYAETTAAMLSVHLLQHYGHRKLEYKQYADGLSLYRLRQVIEYIHAHLDQELGLAELAAIAHLSPHYFARLFKQSTGMSPHQFVIQQRVERAKSLLLAGQDSIADIAQQVGFANQAHLNVHIKRSFGVTPRMILEQRKNR
ncbi:transcriptional regulator, AraC family [Leptolyngbya sp. NIES-3755]|nr:transcriptional regulator, AraC family [Leptolyngbya sp. NIES-3755]